MNIRSLSSKASEVSVMLCLRSRKLIHHHIRGWPQYIHHFRDLGPALPSPWSAGQTWSIDRSWQNLVGCQCYHTWFLDLEPDASHSSATNIYPRLNLSKGNACYRLHNGSAVHLPYNRLSPLAHKQGLYQNGEGSPQFAAVFIFLKYYIHIETISSLPSVSVCV